MRIALILCIAKRVNENGANSNLRIEETGGLQHMGLILAIYTNDAYQ